MNLGRRRIGALFANEFAGAVRLMLAQTSEPLFSFSRSLTFCAA
jgi:hypothetical protein